MGIVSVTALRDPLRTKALAALREGRVTIIEADPDDDQKRPGSVVARVETSRPNSHRYYVVDRSSGARWACTCDAWQSGMPCAHVAAVQLVTGGAS